MLGGWEWLIILLIVLLLFGVGRISQVMAELGRGVRAFREGLQGEEEKPAAAPSEAEKPEKPAE